MKAEIRDQLAHAGVTILALLPLILAPCLWSGLIGGLVIGCLAELKEEASSVSLETTKAVLASRKSLLDIAGYSVTGALLGLLA